MCVQLILNLSTNRITFILPLRTHLLIESTQIETHHQSLSQEHHLPSKGLSLITSFTIQFSRSASAATFAYSCVLAQTFSALQYCHISASRSQSYTFDQTLIAGDSRRGTSWRCQQVWQSLPASSAQSLHCPTLLRCTVCARGTRARPQI